MTAKLLGNRYELMEVIGVGGMAVVYKAKDKLLNRLVAVKILKSEFNDNEQFINKFKRESQAAASLSHNNIVNVFDVGVQDNNHYIVMEYVNGKTLKAYIKEQGKLPWKEALFLIKQIAFALDHAHKNNIIHRDIKPHNILLNEDMIPKVTDFGIARAISSATVTLVEETMGSVHYISPEQARGGFVDAKSDLYSLGIVLYEMLTGEVPFDSDNSVSVAIKHIQEEIRFPEAIQDVPEGLIDIVYKLVKKSPMDRYHNARELIIDLITIQNNPTTRFMDEPDLSDETKKTPIIGDAQLEENKPQDIKETPNKEKFKWGKKQLMAIVLIPIILGIMVFVLVNAFDVEEVKVPDLSNQNMEEAIGVLQEYNLDYRLERENSSSVPIDHVIKQDPVAGTMLKEGQEVVLYISDGVKQVKLPDVTKQYEVEGIQTLENMGFIVNEIERKYNEDYEKGMIYEQSPAPGALLKEGAEIKLYVSQGKDSAVLDDLVGKTIDEAKEILLSEGLTLGSIKEEVSNKYEKNIVINQDPKAGVELQKKAVVNLTISKGLVKSKSISINIASYLYGAEYEEDDNEVEDENGKGKDKDKDKEEPQQVRVKVFVIDDKNVSTLQYENAHLSNETITVELKGVGVQSYQVQINNTIYNAENISF